MREVFSRVLERARCIEARDQRLKPPRYLLREAVVRQLVLELGPAKVLELGYGRGEMQAILAEAGYRVDRIINYGFPLANLLRLVRAPAYVGQNHAGTTDSQRQRQVERSGFVLSGGWIRAGTALFNSCLMRPFVWLQGLFRNTSAGTGFVVVASLREN